MRFLLDHDVYAVTARFLRSLGHDVITANQIGLSQASDLELVTTAKEQGRILVMREPLAELFSFVVRYLTTNGNSARYAERSPFAKVSKGDKHICKRLAR